MDDHVAIHKHLPIELTQNSYKSIKNVNNEM